MPASEEEVTDHKKNFLKEMIGNMISSHVDGQKSKDSLQSIRFDQNRITTEPDSKVSIRMIDNRQNYQDVDEKWAKSGFENSSKRISKMGQQNPNDIKNIKIQKELHSSEINRFNNRTMNEMNKLSCSNSDDEITFVKEAYIYQGITAVDGNDHENSSSNNIDCQNEELDKETVSDDSNTQQMQEGIDIQEQRRCDSVQERKKDRHTSVHVLNGDRDGEAKYMTDIMESEKNNSIDDNSKDLDAESVEEKHDVEKTEKCQEMAYAEHQNWMQMLYSESLSEFIQSISSSSLPMTGSVHVEQKTLKTFSILDSLESAASCKESRRSLEWPGSSIYPRNIFASRQTNISSFLISDEIFSQTSDLRKQHESILFHADKKTCNVNLFSDSIDWNVFKISISQKCESKDVFEMDHWNYGRFQDSESRCNYQNVLENMSIDGHDCHIEMSSIGINMSTVFASDFEECRDPEYVKNNKVLEKEGGDNYFDDPIEQKNNYSLEQLSEYDLCEDIWDYEEFFDKQTDDGFWKVEGGEREDSFSMQTDDGFWKVESVETDDSFSMQIDKEFWKVESIETDDSFKKQTDEDFWEVESVDTVYLFDTLGEQTEKNFGKTEYPENNSDSFQDGDEADFGELKDVENMQELCEEEEDNVGNPVVKDGKKSSYSCKGEKKNIQKPKQPGFRRGKGKKQWKHSNDNKWGSVFPARRWSFNNKKTSPFDVKFSRKQENETTKPNLYRGRRENSCKKPHWKNKFIQILFSITKNTNTRKQNDGHRRNINCIQEFSRKSRNKMPKLFQHKINQGKKQGTKIEERKVEKYKWEKPTNTRQLGHKLTQYFQKPIAFMKWQHISHIRLSKGCNLRINGNSPIRLHLVEARVYTRSGNGKKKSGNYSSSGSGSTNGNQGDGNNSAQRGNGSGRHSGSGSGSGGSGNNNNNNDDHNKNSANQNSGSVHKRSKDKKAKKTGTEETRPYSPDNQNSLPSLPPPILDRIHIAERCSVEGQWKARHFYDETTSEMLPSRIAIASGQQGGAQDVPDGVFDVQDSLCEQEEEISFQHAAISIEQLCDIIGNSTRSFPSGSDTFGILNICLTRIVHDLSLAADDSEGASFDSCSVCLVLSQLLIHMSDPGHDGCVRSCEQCSQIFNLIMEHCIGCIANGRPKSRITQSDLCYKICKYSQWNIEQLCQSSNKLKGKVQKYCDKVLGNTLDMVSTRSSKGIDPEGIGEIGDAVFTDIPSTGVSSTTTLSFSGNIVTAETGDQDQRPTHTEHFHQFVNLPVINSIGALSVGNSSAAVGITGVDSDSHAKLVRKPSHPRKTPAIPQPIPEDSQPESNTVFPDGGDDTERIIYQRMMKKYANQYRYGSLQEGNVHDVEQFLSETNQPLGAPGIGEVVFDYPHQLKIVAGFWDKKREECERTQTCPYQHREEGVILAEYKDYFGILLTRYQKHHQWERVSHLGNGMSGKCHLAIDLKTNFKFCCKKIHLLRYTEEELTLWSEMKNPYVVKLYGAIRHGVKIYIFSEFIDGGSLAACIEEQKYLGRRLSHWSAINYFQQLLKVLAFLQKKNILHEDIKADNILLRRNSIYLAVTDFGTSRRLQDPKELKNKSPVGSPTHWSPEKASMEGHGFPSDLWASVCVLVHMVSGEPPWVKRFMHKAAILNFIIFHRPPPMEDVPDNIQLVVRDLITKGFVKDPQARPSSSELLQHPAFKILDEGTPETYFSTLTSMAHGFPVIQAAVGGVEQQSVRKDMFSTAESTPADATVLYAGKVSPGPYQESDSRPDNMNKQPGERIASVINPNENVRTTDQQQNEADRNKSIVIDQSKIDRDVRDEGLAACVETQNEQLQNAPDIASPVENQVSVVGSSVDSKVRQLVGPLDIDSLLPQFNELFMSGDSLSTQSIKSFFADAYSTEEFNGAKPSPLEMYKPEEKLDVLPNLSIFDWEAAPLTRQQDEVSESENFICNLSQISTLPGVTNPPIRGRLQGRPVNSQNTINFMLSSESDECTSADLFEPEPAARTPDSGQYGSNISDVHAEACGSETQRPSMTPLEDMSPTASTSGSSNTSTLQMRKPTNLTLHCTPLPPELPHSRSGIQLLSAQSTSESEMKHRSNTWSQLSTTHIPQHTGSTPNSSQVTSTLKKTNGTSVPSTASSGHSQFSYHRSSVKEEQEKRIQELTTDMLSAYSTSSDSDTSFFYHQQEKYTDVAELEDKPDIDTVFKTMLEEMDETKLGGHNLKFFNDGNNHLFTMHIEELPANWRHFITSFRHKITTQFGYIHFSVNHMNNKPVKYHHPLGAHEFKVIRLQVSGEQCWCYRCKPMY